MTHIILNHRTIIEVKGIDAVTYLQGLTTNDMTTLTPGNCIYTAFLNPQGKFLNDAFAIMPATDHVWLDVEAEHSDALLKKLTMYRLRSQVALALRPDVMIYAYFDEPTIIDEAIIVNDPRTADMGWRVYTSIQQEAHGDINAYDMRRIPLCIPDGTRDIPYERGFIMEYGFDQLNAINFQKGCYVGQELTARMYYRKLGKRQLVCAMFEHNAPSSGAEVMQDGMSVGTIRSSVGHMALAHIKTEALEKASILMVDGETFQVNTHK